MRQEKFVNVLVHKTESNEIEWKRISSENFFSLNALLEKFNVKSKKNSEWNLDRSFFTLLNNGIIFILTHKLVNSEYISLNIQPHSDSIVRNYSDVEKSDLLTLRNIIEENHSRYNQFINEVINEPRNDFSYRLIDENLKKKPYSLYSKAYDINSMSNPSLKQLKIALNYLEYITDNFRGTKNAKNANKIIVEIRNKIKRIDK